MPAHQTMPERDFSAKKRQAMDLSDFGDPDKRAFPVMNQGDLDNAARLIGHADNPAAVKKRLIAIAKRKGLTLPQSWQEEEKPKESTIQPALLSTTSDRFTPKPRIARLKVCWIEDDAISANGRQYPREAVDTLIRSAQMQLSDPNSIPLTCYISHEAADNDKTLDLVGKLSEVWREGTRGMAYIDIPDTRAGRDVASLAAGGYLKTESLRAENAKITLDKTRGIPQVGGDGIVLRGIDFTTMPGLTNVARVQNVLLESSENEYQALTDAFALPTSHLSLCEEGDPMTAQLSLDDALKEAYSLGDNNRAANPGTTGDSPFMTSDPTTDAYGAKMFGDPPKGDPMMGVHPSGNLEDGMDGVHADLSGVQEAHDRIATVQGRPCAPAGMESATRRALTEAGRKLSASTHAHLDKAHDALAHHLQMACEGQARDAIDPDHDGDDDRTNDPAKNPDWQQDQARDGMESRRPAARPTAPYRTPVATTTQLKETRKPMSMEDAARLLEQAGYKVDRPKTELEKLQEKMQADMDARLQEQARQFEELKALIAANASQQTGTQNISETPQRKSMVVGANAHTPGELAERKVYTHGAYLKEKIYGLDWNDLADRTAPLPQGINVKWLLSEFGHLRIKQHFDRFGWPDEG